jgi:hypothetical protein
MVQIVDRNQALLRRRRHRTLMSEPTRPTAVADVLQLTDDPVRVAKQQIEAIAADRHIDFHGPGVIGFRDSMCGKRRDHAIKVEVLHSEAVVPNAG